MSKTNDGGPAFPFKFASESYIDQDPIVSHGMSLRDWFAGQAMASINISEVLEAFRRNDYIGKQSHNIYAPVDSFNDLALCAYRLADAMLAAREKERP